MSLNYSKYGIQEKAIPKIYVNRIMIDQKGSEAIELTFNCNVLFDFPSYDQFVSFCSGDCFDYLFENYIFFYHEELNTSDPEILSEMGKSAGELSANTNNFILNEAELNQVFNKVAYDNSNSTLEENLAKYSRTLPNGEKYYQLSYQTKFELPLADLTNIYFLASVVSQKPQINLSFNFGKYGDLIVNSDVKENDNVDVIQQSLVGVVRGPITGETISINGVIQDKGVIYHISDDQRSYPDGIPSSLSPLPILARDEERDQTFNSIKGTLWVGEIHKFNANRYMAGGTHGMDGLHPFVDPTPVPNMKIIDLRKINLLVDEKIDFSSAGDDFLSDNQIQEVPVNGGIT